MLKHTLPLNKNKHYRLLIPVRAAKTIILKPGFEYQIPAHPESSECFKNAPDYYHLITPSKVIKNIPALQMPEAVTRNSLKYVQVANRGNKPITIKADALTKY